MTDPTPALSDEQRATAAEHFRRRMNGIYAEEWEEWHRRKGLDPMRCNDFICLRAVEEADAAAPLIARMVAGAEARALREAARDLPGFDGIRTHGDAAAWLRDRADRIGGAR